MTSSDVRPRPSSSRPDPPGAPQGPSMRRRDGARRRLPRAVVAVLALAFFFTPAVAAVLGVHAKPFENKRLAAFPSLSQGWHVFPGLTAWATDHLPLRDRAVRADSSASKRLFGQLPDYGTGGANGDAGVPVGPPPASTAPKPGADVTAGAGLISGRNGFLFLADDMNFACTPTRTLSATLAGVDRLAAIVRRAGGRLLLVVPPDKSSVETSELPSSFGNRSCGLAAKAAFWARMKAAPPAGYVDIYDRLLSRRAQEGHTLYKPQDTHWTAEGGATYAQGVADALDPRLWQTTALVSTGPVRAVGDLARLTGTPTATGFPGYEVRRAGVTTLPYTGGTVGQLGIARFRSTTTGAPLYQPRVTILGDSFTGTSEPQLQPLFADITQVNIKSAAADTADTATLLLSSRVVVVEAVERAFASGREPLLDTATLAALDAAVTRALAARH